MKLTLVASDGTRIPVDRDVASQSLLLQKMMEALGWNTTKNEVEEDVEEDLPCSSIDGPTLEKIVEWCVTHRHEPALRKKETENPYTHLTEDDEAYLNLNSAQMSDILAGANYLDIPGLVDIITQKIANLARGKNVEELREMLGLANDFTPEQEDKVDQRVQWY